MATSFTSDSNLQVDIWMIRYTISYSSDSAGYKLVLDFPFDEDASALNSWDAAVYAVAGAIAGQGFTVSSSIVKSFPTDSFVADNPNFFSDPSLTYP